MESINNYEARELAEFEAEDIVGGWFAHEPEPNDIRFDGTGHAEGTDWYDENGHMYKVKKNDNLYTIAKHFGLDWHIIRKDNWQIKKQHYVFPGDVIRLEL